MVGFPQIPGAAAVNGGQFAGGVASPAGLVASGGVYKFPLGAGPTLGTFGVTANRIYYCVHHFSTSATITSVSFENTAGTGNGRVAVYELSSSGVTLLQESSSAAIGSSAIHDIDITNITAGAGKSYLTGIQFDATITCRSHAGCDLGFFHDFPVQQFDNSNGGGWREDRTYAAFPAAPTFEQIAETPPIVALKLV